MLRQEYRHFVINADRDGTHVNYKALKLLSDNMKVFFGLPAHSSNRTHVLDYFSPSLRRFCETVWTNGRIVKEQGFVVTFTPFVSSFTRHTNHQFRIR